MRATCILFDHDDTLVPTFPIRVRALEAALGDLSLEAVDAAAYLAAAHGRNLEEMSNDLAGGDARLARRLVTAYRERYYSLNRGGLEPYDGIEPTLHALRAAGVRLAVVTSKLGWGAREELERIGLHVHFEAVVGAEDVTECKPAAEPLLRAMSALGADPGSTVMVGDTAADVLGARAAGTASAAALWGASDRAGLLALGPDHALERPAELLDRFL